MIMAKVDKIYIDSQINSLILFSFINNVYVYKKTVPIALTISLFIIS